MVETTEMTLKLAQIGLNAADVTHGQRRRIHLGARFERL
jgi:hypothetical protein